MRRISWLALAGVCAVLPGSARAGLDLNSPILCAMVDVYDCSGAECIEVVSSAVGVPDLVRLDPAAKTLTALDIEFDGLTTQLDSVSSVGGRIAANALEGDRTLTFTVNEETGDSLLIMSDLKVTLIAYGACVKN